LALLYRAEGEDFEAERLYERALVIHEKVLGSNHPQFAKTLNNLACLHRDLGRNAVAKQLFARAINIFEASLGADHPNLIAPLGNLAEVHRREQDYVPALSAIRKATGILRKRGSTCSALYARGLIAEQLDNTATFHLHMRISAEGRKAGTIDAASALDDMLEVCQLARISETGRAIARMAARFASGESEIASLACRRESAVDCWSTLSTRLIEEVCKVPAKRSPELEASLQSQASDAEAAIKVLDAEIASRDPRYAELTNPQPLSLQSIQLLLENDEAIVIISETSDASYACVLRSKCHNFMALEPGRHAIGSMVQRLRTTLDPRHGRHVKPSPEAQSYVTRFDLRLAHQLYCDVWAPIEPFLLSVRRVFFVPDKGLESLPLHLLISAPVLGEGLNSLREVKWVAKHPYSISVIPTVSSLYAFRELSNKTPTGDEFIGFGNPMLGGDREPDIRSVALNSRGFLPNVDQLRSLVALPETTDELETLAANVMAKKKKNFLGPSCTEHHVKALSNSGDLARAGVIAFATHGAMAGELKGFNEPGLVLTPPQQPTEEDDGFLTASEVSQLNLDAEWVILSACNTAAADGTPGAEGFSGLTRAFFYAGARNLLVSHWCVTSDAAVKLTTGTMAKLRRGVSSRAEALRQTMVELIDQGPDPSPSYWAPFTVVGQ
jgi:CHAT domain-containing protein/tetratricopeptide (TPR) repeat protein